MLTPAECDAFADHLMHISAEQTRQRGGTLTPQQLEMMDKMMKQARDGIVKMCLKRGSMFTRPMFECMMAATSPADFRKCRP